MTSDRRLSTERGRWRDTPVEFVSRRVIVKLRRPDQAEAVRLAAPGAEIVRPPNPRGRMVLLIAEDADVADVAATLNQRGDVEYAEPDMVDHASLVPNDTRVGEQWALDAIDLYETWDVEQGDPTILIGIIDSGISLTTGGALNHPDLSDTGRTILGFDYIGDDAIPRDENAHGTHVAGIAAATGNNATGIAGANWGSKLYITRTLDLNGDGSVADFALAMEEITDYAVANNLKAVINYSAGGATDTQARRDACEYASNAGMILCAATGNDVAGPVNFPAAYSTTITGVIAVGATQSNGTVASYSNVGAEVTVVAPGSVILSTVPTYAVTDAVALDYESWNGTSMATPYVAGVIALMWSRLPGASNTLIRKRLISTAVPLGAGTFDNSWGHGIVAADTAVAAMDAPVLGDADAVYTGTTAVSKVYLGTTVVWEPAAVVDPSLTLVQSKTLTTPEAVNTSTTTVTLDSPATAGNFLWAAYAFDKNAGTITPPTGFTQFMSHTSTSVSIWVGYKTAVGGEQSISATRGTAAANGNTGWVGEYSNAATGSWSVVGQATNPTDETSVASWSSGTTGATSAVGGALAFFAVDSGQNVTGAEAFTNSFTALTSTSGVGGGAAMVVAFKDGIAAASTVETTYSHTGTDQHSGAVAVFRKA